MVNMTYNNITCVNESNINPEPYFAQCREGLILLEDSEINFNLNWSQHNKSNTAYAYSMCTVVNFLLEIRMKLNYIKGIRKKAGNIQPPPKAYHSIRSVSSLS